MWVVADSPENKEVFAIQADKFKEGDTVLGCKVLKTFEDSGPAIAMAIDIMISRINELRTSVKRLEKFAAALQEGERRRSEGQNSWPYRRDLMRKMRVDYSDKDAYTP